MQVASWFQNGVSFGIDSPMEYAAMPETAPKRRRWLRISLALALTLLATAIAWQFLPLNATERSLVGTWLVDNDLAAAAWGTKAAAPTVTLQLDAHRGFVETMTFPVRTAPVTTSGTWTAAETSLRLRANNVTDITPLPWTTRARLAVKTFFRRPKTLRIEDPDCIWIDNTRYTRLKPAL